MHTGRLFLLLGVKSSQCHSSLHRNTLKVLIQHTEGARFATDVRDCVTQRPEADTRGEWCVLCCESLSLYCQGCVVVKLGTFLKSLSQSICKFFWRIRMQTFVFLPTVWSCLLHPMDSGMTFITLHLNYPFCTHLSCISFKRQFPVFC